MLISESSLCVAEGYSPRPPFGMTGARILTTLHNDLADTGGRYGLETMCVAGGQGMALIVENLRR